MGGSPAPLLPEEGGRRAQGSQPAISSPVFTQGSAGACAALASPSSARSLVAGEGLGCVCGHLEGPHWVKVSSGLAPALGAPAGTSPEAAGSPTASSSERAVYLTETRCSLFLLCSPILFFLCLWIFTVVALPTQNLTTCTDGTVSLDTWPCCLGAAWAPVVLRAEQVSSAGSALDVRCLCACVCVHTRVFKGAAEIHGEFGAETLLSGVLRYNWYTKLAHIQGTQLVASGHLYAPVSPSAPSRSWTPASPGGSSRPFLWGEHLAGRGQCR